jgi:hypothetical protein
MVMEINCCKNCRFLFTREYQALTVDYIEHRDFECRRYPPSIYGVFAKTTPKNWCGEWIKGEE